MEKLAFHKYRKREQKQDTAVSESAETLNRSKKLGFSPQIGKLHQNIN
jgi:hypothetical protein